VSADTFSEALQDARAALSLAGACGRVLTHKGDARRVRRFWSALRRVMLCREKLRRLPRRFWRDVEAARASELKAGAVKAFGMSAPTACQTTYRLVAELARLAGKCGLLGNASETARGVVVDESLAECALVMRNRFLAGRNPQAGLPEFDDLLAQVRLELAVLDRAKAEAPEAKAKPVRAKKSTVRGEAQEKLRAALLAHHQYENGSCLNTAPIGRNALARLAKVSLGSVTDFFKRNFDGHKAYQRLCAEPSDLGIALKVLAGELTPRELQQGKFDDLSPEVRKVIERNALNEAREMGLL